MKIRCRCLGCGAGRQVDPDEGNRCDDEATQEDGLCDGCRNGDNRPWLSEIVEVMA